MPQVETTWLKAGKLGVTNEQTIKNVQPQAIAIIGSPELLKFKRLEYGSELESYKAFKEDIRNAFITFYNAHEDKNLQKIVDSCVYEDFLSEVFDNASEKAISLVKDGSIYSDTLKTHLLSEYPDLKEDMLKKVPKVASGAKASKPKIDTESIGVDLDDI